MPNGVKLTEDLAQRTKRVVESYEQQRGSFSKVARQMPTPRRQARYYVTPAAGIPAPPAGEHTVSSADCMLLKFDATQSAFVPVRDEKVYSLHAYPGNTRIEVEQINGRPFARSPGGEAAPAGTSLKLAQAGSQIGIPNGSSGLSARNGSTLGFGQARDIGIIGGELTSSTIGFDQTTIGTVGEPFIVYNPWSVEVAHEGEKLFWYAEVPNQAGETIKVYVNDDCHDEETGLQISNLTVTAPIP